VIEMQQTAPLHADPKEPLTDKNQVVIALTSPWAEEQFFADGIDGLQAAAGGLCLAEPLGPGWMRVGPIEDALQQKLRLASFHFRVFVIFLRCGRTLSLEL